MIYAQKSPQQIKREISNKVKQLEPLRDFIKQSIERLNDDVYKSIKEAEEDYEIKKNAADNLKERNSTRSSNKRSWEENSGK